MCINVRFHDIIEIGIVYKVSYYHMNIWRTDTANIKIVLLNLCYVYFWMNQGVYFEKDGQFLKILAGLVLNIHCVDRWGT